MQRIFKICRSLGPMILTLALLLSFSLVYGAQLTATADETTEIVETNEAVETIAVEELAHLNIDLDLRDEIMQAKDVLSKFPTNDPDGFYVYPDPQKAAEPYIPQGSVCTEVCIIGYVVSFDYRIGNVRYIASYCNDGTVRMTASILAEEIDYVYEITSDAPDIVKCIDCHRNEIVWEKETETSADTP